MEIVNQHCKNEVDNRVAIRAAVPESEGQTALKTINQSKEIIEAMNEHLKRHPGCECCMGILEVALFTSICPYAHNHKEAAGAIARSQRQSSHEELTNDHST